MWIAARQTETRSHDANGTVDLRNGCEGLEQPSLENLRMLEDGGHVENFAGRHSVLVEQGRPLLRRSRCERSLNLGIELEQAALAILAVAKARVVDKLLAADQAA